MEEFYFLSELVKAPVVLNGEKIGNIDDFIIVDKDKIAEVTHIYVSRPFGESALTVPWEKVAALSRKAVVIDIANIEQYSGPTTEGTVLLKDHILDKKVLDGKGREVEVVYDVKLAMRHNKLYVIEVDLSKYGLLRRIGLKWFVNFIYSAAQNIGKQMIAWDYVQPLPDKLDSFQGKIQLKVLKEELADMPPVHLADLLEEMEHEHRLAIFSELGTKQASDILEELDPRVQRSLIASLNIDKAVILIDEMTPGQAADVLSVLPSMEAKTILRLLRQENRMKIQGIMDKQEGKVLDFVDSNFLRFSPEQTVLQARKYLRASGPAKEAIRYLYVLDSQEKLLGVITLFSFILAEDETLLKDIMRDNVIYLKPEGTLKQASETFARYGFRALPVTDENGKMLGVLPYRDIVNLRRRDIK